MIEFIVSLIVAAIATEAFTEIVTTAKITDGRRAAVKRAALSRAALTDAYSTVIKFVDAVLSCSYCCSVWVAVPFAFVPAVSWPFKFLLWPIGFVIVVMAVHRLSNFFHGFVSLATKGRVRVHDLAISRLEVVLIDGTVGKGPGSGIDEEEAGRQAADREVGDRTEGAPQVGGPVDDGAAGAGDAG